MVGGGRDAGRRRGGHDSPSASTPLDPKEFLARVLMHIPEPRRHVIRYYGEYSSVVRARRARQTAARVGGGSTVTPLPAAHEPASLEWRAARRRWAQLIRRIDEVDPLVLFRCGATMRIIAYSIEAKAIGVSLSLLHGLPFGAEPPADFPRLARNGHPVPSDGLDWTLPGCILKKGQERRLLDIT